MPSKAEPFPLLSEQLAQASKKAGSALELRKKPRLWFVLSAAPLFFLPDNWIPLPERLQELALTRRPVGKWGCILCLGVYHLPSFVGAVWGQRTSPSAWRNLWSVVISLGVYVACLPHIWTAPQSTDPGRLLDLYLAAAIFSTTVASSCMGFSLC